MLSSSAPQSAQSPLVAAERNLDAIAALRIAKGWRKTMPPLPGARAPADSVRIGLHALPPECEWALVHDGVRPFVTSLMIEDGLRAAADTGAAIAVVPAFDTVKRVAADGRVIETLDRSELAMTQTPQVFRRAILEARSRRGDGSTSRTTQRWSSG